MYRQMKLALAAGVLLSLGATGLASAADVPLKAKPVLAPVTPWTGCYIGGNVGGAWDRIDTTLVQSDAIGPVFANYGREKDSGFIGGGQAGCDFQAGTPITSPNADAARGCCTACITRARTGSTSAAK